LRALATAVVLLVSAKALAADHDPLFGAQLAIGGGACMAPGRARGGLFELAPRAELLLGREAAAGLAVELRTANLGTFELTGALAGILSDGDFGAMAALGAGYAWRRADQDGAVLSASLGYGIVHGQNGLLATTAIYVTFRHAATGASRDELTAGLSLGGGVLNAVARIGRM
jgi:hypothetical protein